MIGPSSSHTAGAARIGSIARSLLSNPPIQAEIALHGSFAKTYKGHGTDKAMIAGILGLRPDDDRIRDSIELAQQEGLIVHLKTTNLENAHPNTAVITLTDTCGHSICIQASSVGGGNVRVTKINGMDVDITGQHHTFIVLHQDEPGTIAEVTELMARQQLNICSFHLSRQTKGGIACMTIEVDGSTDRDLNDQITRLPHILSSTLLTAI